MMGMDETVDVEALIGKNVINALATIVFDGAKEVEIPLKLRNGKNYKNYWIHCEEGCKE